MGLAFAAGIKIYPAVFGVILIKERKWADAVRLVIYGVVLFFVPFFFFEGMDSIKGMIYWLTHGTYVNDGFGYNFNFNNMLSIVSFLVCGKTTVSMAWSLIPAALSALLIFFSSDRYINLIGIMLFIIMVPGFSCLYMLIFMIIPLLEFLKQKKETSDKASNYGVGTKCEVSGRSVGSNTADISSECGVGAESDKCSKSNKPDLFILLLYVIMLSPGALGWSRSLNVIKEYDRITTRYMIVMYICVIMFFLYYVLLFFKQLRSEARH